MGEIISYELIQYIMNTGDVPDVYYFTRDNYTNYELRRSYTTKVSWSLISGNFVDALAEFLKGSKCLEIYGGYGLLSHQLQLRDIDIRCTDSKSWDVMNFDIQYTDVEKIDAISAVKSYDKESLDYVIASWIPYEDTTCVEVLKELYRNQKQCKLIYIGEGPDGCTACYDFFDYVNDLAFDYANDPTDKKGYRKAFTNINNHFQRWQYINDEVYLLKPHKHTSLLEKFN